MRKFEIACLTPHSDIEIMQAARLAPSLPCFENAFAALGRGAMLQTDTGPRAVDDLLPGDMVQTASHGLQKLLWRGTTLVVPGGQNRQPEMGTLTRLTADALGPGRPAPDLVLGPSARLFHRAPGIARLTGAEAAFVPARDFIDQSQIIELTPATPVPVYQLGFAMHCRIRVNGVEVESLHPGAAHMLGLRGDMLTLFLSMFPHKNSLSDFGDLLYPRMRLRDLDLTDVA